MLFRLLSYNNKNYFLFGRSCFKKPRERHYISLSVSY
uniref:Uncharacterized protein n=1 Tax=Bacteriophage sp. TaxID=38018 RepID=A0A8D9PEB7_9VIRU|nr:MAG TPA: hypothetical protein [Bacteriophage sp.]